MKTCEQLKLQSLKQTIKECSIEQKLLKMERKLFIANKKEFLLDWISNPKNKLSRYGNPFESKLSQFNSNIQTNKNRITAIHQEIEKMTKKGPFHITKKREIHSYNYIPKIFKYETYILCMEINELKIYKTTSLTETGFITETNFIGIPETFKYEDILQIGKKEDLYLTLCEIKKKIEETKEYLEYKDITNSHDKQNSELQSKYQTMRNKKSKLDKEYRLKLESIDLAYAKNTKAQTEELLKTRELQDEKKLELSKIKKEIIKTFKEITK